MGMPISDCMRQIVVTNVIIFNSRRHVEHARDPRHSEQLRDTRDNAQSKHMEVGTYIGQIDDKLDLLTTLLRDLHGHQDKSEEETGDEAPPTNAPRPLPI